jgi:hypothetical protein
MPLGADLAPILLQLLTEGLQTPFQSSADLPNEGLEPIPKRPRFLMSNGSPTMAGPRE